MEIIQKCHSIAMLLLLLALRRLNIKNFTRRCRHLRLNTMIRNQSNASGGAWESERQRDYWLVPQRYCQSIISIFLLAALALSIMPEKSNELLVLRVLIYDWEYYWITRSHRVCFMNDVRCPKRWQLISISLI